MSEALVAKRKFRCGRADRQRRDLGLLLREMHSIPTAASTSLWCSAGIATATRADRLPARRSSANPAPLAQRSVRRDSANEGALPQWTEAVAQTIQILTGLVRVGDGVQLRP
jgi:hypothetical protein